MQKNLLFRKKAMEIEAFVKEKDISGISVGQKAYVDGTEHKVLSISDETVSAEAHFSNDMVHLERLTEQDMFYVLDLSGVCLKVRMTPRSLRKSIRHFPCCLIEVEHEER